MFLNTFCYYLNKIGYIYYELKLNLCFVLQSVNIDIKKEIDKIFCLLLWAFI